MRGLQQPPLTATHLAGGWLALEWSSCYTDRLTNQCIQSRHIECGKDLNLYDETSSRGPIVPPVVQLRRPGIEPQSPPHQRTRSRHHSTLCQGNEPSRTRDCPQLNGC